MPLIVGIDPSARKIAIVATHTTLRVSHVKSYVLYKSSERQTAESMGLAVEAMQEFILWVESVETRGERFAWVEDPVVGRSVTATTKQCFISGIIRGHLALAGFSVYGANVSSWKKSVIGNGNADKAAVLAHVQRAWPKIVPRIGIDGDLADAAAINLYGQGVNRTAVYLDNAGLGGSGLPE